MPRNLQMLIVDDQNKSLNRDHIDIVRCITLTGPETTDRISNWTQHLRLYMEDEVPEFDLMLVDVSFDQDKTAPYSSDQFNPYGLLHALPLAARQHYSSLPFAWVIGTHKRDNMKENHVAVFAYGLLRAMEKRVDPKFLFSGTFEHFQERIDKLEGLEDQKVFDRLMQRYREQLKNAAAEGRIEFDLGELQKYTSAASRGDRQSMSNLLDSGITIYYRYQMEEINLRSIFADYSRKSDHDLEFVAVVRSYLDELKKVAENVNIYPAVAAALKGLKEDTESNITSFVQHSDLHVDLVKVAVIVCLWLEEYVRVKGGKISAQQICTATGLKYNQVQGILQRFYGAHHQLKHFFLLLSNEPLEPPSLFNCAARYWDEVLKSKAKGVVPLPGCLRETKAAAAASNR